MEAIMGTPGDGLINVVAAAEQSCPHSRSSEAARYCVPEAIRLHDSRHSRLSNNSHECECACQGWYNGLRGKRSSRHLVLSGFLETSYEPDPTVEVMFNALEETTRPQILCEPG